jgi:SAM-dependent MidA family methyltransferase
MSRPADIASDAPDADAWEHSRRLLDSIRREAHACGGLLPFDRFMELALYAPGLGYYVAGTRKLGRDGDFVTAPELSPLFGRCNAEQCREVLAALGPAGGSDILEFGAGTGALAAEVLSCLGAHDALPRRYLILEPSPELRQRQQRLLAERAPELLARVRWLDRLPEGFQGCVLANEVLDAMPVHRFRIGADGRPREIFVRPSPEGLEDVHGEVVSPGLTAAVQALQDRGLAVDPGFESEINLRLGHWISALSEALARGVAFILDYGYPQAEYYRDDRNRGTLMCHYRHRAQADPYVHLGLQDIGAHVDFTAVAEAGASTGLHLAGYTTQANFLIGCGIDRLLAQASEEPNALDLVLGAKQLLLPSAMGERFQVIALDKGVSEDWKGFSFRDLRDQLDGGRPGSGGPPA